MKLNIKKLSVIPAVLFWIAVWHFASLRVNKSVLLPSPIQMLEVFRSLVSDKAFWTICLTSVKTVFGGAFVGILVGLALAALSYLSPVFKCLFSPIMSLIKSTPIASVIILFLVWIGRTRIPFVISLLMVAPIVASNALTALENIDRELSEVARVYRLGFSKRWKMLYRPTVLPYLNSALTSSVSLAWKAGIATEVLCTPENTIGKMLYESKLYLETPTLFAWTFTVIVISYLLERAVVLLSNRIMGGRKK